MTEKFCSTPAALARLHAGPLGPHMKSFASVLSEKGYSKRAAQRRLRFVADLSHWLEEQSLQVEDLDEEKIARFEEQVPRSPGVVREARPVLPVLLEHLREIGAAAQSEPLLPDGALECTLHDFSQYLLQQRGLAPRTVTRQCRVIREFLGERFGSGPILLGQLSAVDVRQFVLRRAQAGEGGHVGDITEALRGFLRSVQRRGEIDTDLAATVPSLATEPAKLPESLEPEQVHQLLASCDLGKVDGLRDYAILLLLARLGLRAGEVVALRLSDLDWNSGEITVRGKGMRRDRLPMLQDVGEALVAYLCEGRPRCSSPQVFIRLRAPYRGLAHSSSVSMIVCRALKRAGLDVRHHGAHLLRHTLATEMLRRGASLKQIAQILRHRDIQTTEIYARVDLGALRDLAQPWPGGGR